MNTETYEILALAARYWFIALAALMVFKGWRASVRDNRKARALRDWSGGSGAVGELVVIEDGVRSRKRSLKGARFPVPEEGLIGSGSTADIRIRHSDLKGKHVWFSYQPGGMLLTLAGRAQAETPVAPDGRRILRDGDYLVVGRLRLMMVFYGVRDASVIPGTSGKRRPRPRKPVDDEYEDLYEESFWE